MGVNRREFLSIAGVASLLGLGAKSAFGVFAREKPDSSKMLPNPGAVVGKRWAMVVDPKKCLAKMEREGDCKDCFVACHRLHNVPDVGNPKDEVKWIWHEKYEHVFPGQGHPYSEDRVRGKPFVVLCNHCDNPPCVRVCPTKATFKREDGIVMMDYHRCIGCRFCMAGCPFGSRSFNWRDPRPFLREINPDFPTRTKGVVEKCNFCAERLSKGLVPACVEACKEKALVFGDVENPDSEVRALLRSHYTVRRKPELGTMPQVYYIV